MRVAEGMNEVVLSVGPAHTLRDVARRMTERKVGAAIVLDAELPQPGIVTERDVLRAVAADLDLDAERVADHATMELMSAAPDWSLERAAELMVRGSFRHVVVVEGAEVVGVLSMRDVVRCWTTAGATSEVESVGT